MNSSDRYVTGLYFSRRPATRDQDTRTLVCCGDLDLDPMTSIYEFDCDILKICLHTL